MESNNRPRETGVPIGIWNGSDAVNTASSQQARRIERLTWALIGLSVVLVIGLVVQVWIAVRQPNPVPGQQKEIQLLQKQLSQSEALNTKATQLLTTLQKK